MRSLQYANSMHSMHPSLLGSVKMSRINPVHSLRRRRPPLWLRPDLSRVCAIQGISQTTSLGLSLLQHDAVAFAGVLATAFVWIKLAGLLTERKLVDKVHYSVLLLLNSFTDSREENSSYNHSSYVSHLLDLL